MMVISQGRTDIVNQTDEQRAARERMALFPSQAEVLFTSPEIWVVSKPVSLRLGDALTACLACGSASREALRISGHSEAVPEDAQRPCAVSATSAAI